MSDIAIKVEGLGKRYKIGKLQRRHDTLRDRIADTRLFNLFKRRNGNSHHSSLITHHSEESDTLWALRDVSFEVKRGEVVGIIGRNGAGKSTLLKILSRITEPTEGYADINGRVASLLEVGTGFHPELTGRENIYLNGSILGMKRVEIESKFDEIVAFAEIETFIDTPVKYYSSGMYVRLAFAVAAHLESEILIVDEVLAVGDAEFQRKCLGKMGDVAGSGRTVLFVSHNMAAMRRICELAIWLDSGQVKLRGEIDEVTGAYMQSSSIQTDRQIELSNLRRLHEYGSRLKLRRVEFNDGDPLVHGERLKVRLDFQAIKDVKDVAIGLGFCSLEGIRLVSFDSDLEVGRADFPSGHHGSVTMKIPKLYLQPGKYLVDLGSRTGVGTPLDYLPACFEIEVLPGEFTPSQIIRFDGGVRFPAQWLWTETSSVQ